METVGSHVSHLMPLMVMNILSAAPGTLAARQGKEARERGSVLVHIC
jgi:hypothetical protein